VSKGHEPVREAGSREPARVPPRIEPRLGDPRPMDLRTGDLRTGDPRPAELPRSELTPERRAWTRIDPRRAALLGGAAILLLGLAFWIGRWSSPPVDAGERPRNRMLAAEPRVPPTAAPRETVPSEPATDSAIGGGAAAGNADTADDRAFRNAANQYTVRVIEYRNDERGRELAWACYSYMRKEGLPAIRPIEQGSSIILYVGASSSTEELDGIVEFVSQMRGPPPLSRAGEFKDAFRVNIDRVIRR
jgi:hypothetical protein